MFKTKYTLGVGSQEGSGDRLDAGQNSRPTSSVNMSELPY